MHIQLETTEKNAIDAYSQDQIQVNSIVYTQSLILSKEKIITNLSIKNIQEMDEFYVQQLLECQPEVIIIGHNHSGAFPPILIMSKLSQQGIGIESMSVGAACRTYNVLLNEQRAVVAGFIFS